MRCAHPVEVLLRPSSRPGKKYDAVLAGASGRTKTVSFGARGMSDYTRHGDAERKERYLTRHRRREHWADVETPGFWSRWLLWNKPSLGASKKDVERRFCLRIQPLP